LLVASSPLAEGLVAQDLAEGLVAPDLVAPNLVAADLVAPNLVAADLVAWVGVGTSFGKEEDLLKFVRTSKRTNFKTVFFLSELSAWCLCVKCPCIKSPG
jgi:hypothetical protein